MLQGPTPFGSALENQTFSLPMRSDFTPGYEVEIPTKEIDCLNCQEPEKCSHQGRSTPIGAIGPHIHEHCGIKRQQRKNKQSDDGEQLFGSGGCAGPVPSQAIPPERWRNFPTESIRRIQIASASQWHKATKATVALEGFGQPIGFENSAAAARTWIALAEPDDLLSEGDMLIRRMEHVSISLRRTCFRLVLCKI